MVFTGKRGIVLFGEHWKECFISFKNIQVYYFFALEVEGKQTLRIWCLNDAYWKNSFI